MNTKTKTQATKSVTRRTERSNSKPRTVKNEIYEICFTPIGALKSRLENAN
jgi:hypothetical protein